VEAWIRYGNRFEAEVSNAQAFTPTRKEMMMELVLFLGLQVQRCGAMTDRQYTEE